MASQWNDNTQFNDGIAMQSLAVKPPADGSTSYKSDQPAQPMAAIESFMASMGSSSGLRLKTMPVHWKRNMANLQAVGRQQKTGKLHEQPVKSAGNSEGWLARVLALRRNRPGNKEEFDNKISKKSRNRKATDGARTVQGCGARPIISSTVNLKQKRSTKRNRALEKYNKGQEGVDAHTQQPKRSCWLRRLLDLRGKSSKIRQKLTSNALKMRGSTTGACKQEIHEIKVHKLGRCGIR